MLREWTARQVELICRRIFRRHDRDRASAIEHVALGASHVLGNNGETTKVIQRLRGD